MPTSEDETGPIYRVIADKLRKSIITGELVDGQRVPGENELMRRYGVARATARQALRTLIDEGIVTPVRGSGNFVRSFRPVRRHAPKRLSAELWGRGRPIWDADAGDRTVEVDNVSVREVRPPEHVARALDLPESATTVRRQRRYLVDNRPLQLATSYLPAELARGDGAVLTAVDTGPGGIYARLDELGSAPAHFTEELRVRMPGPHEAEALSLAPGTPVIEVVRTALTAHQQAVELNEMVLDGSAHVLAYDFDA
ncbi:GntR family transcriptional regulator [Lipingzhangella sp. LS1_29]|uniref:GntR family transcriptional regulator n=1 Tax=Lipingzhangella rawalii TaxID=2055835 RepID=A0ABU2H0N8_9ACTN|nr:GntR family transcriptional regulator [Lipingzhangella rawalii]MDS1268868.1 GntR family transcriptional regulator [Lipingzhangella rawalii]